MELSLPIKVAKIL